MGYNKFRWWSNSKRKKPLSDRAPLFDKIQNGDYNYSYLFEEAEQVKSLAKKAYEDTYKNYGGTDEKNRIESSLEASRMKRLRAIKLQLEAYKDEQKILYKLQKDFKHEKRLQLYLASITLRDFRRIHIRFLQIYVGSAVNNATILPTQRALCRTCLHISD